VSQQQDVIRMLEQAGPEGVTSNQFYAACLPRFSARIHELRNKGFDIRKEPVEQGHFRYTLHRGQSRAPGETLRDGPGHPPAGASIQAVPEPLFEVDEDGPSGPVNPYDWEAA
jgi:hypothetical protein